ncbi:magnesium chelatase subunit D [Nevskia sp.]|uniref:magnesium chelatase subunit D n=1 Tax=Nevskia sp. TaxID=1929292 RepID=UPI003F6F1BFB
MTADADPARGRDALSAAALFAVDPQALGGVAIRALAGPVRDQWLALLCGWLPPEQPWRRVPLNIADGRLLGGLDLSATLSASRPIAERGLLAEADGGVLLLTMAERLSAGTVARLAAVLDDGELRLARDGIAATVPARVAVIALDEGIEADEGLAAPLLDRLAFRLDLDGLRRLDTAALGIEVESLAAARARLPNVELPDAVIAALTATAEQLGIASLRAIWLATRAARAAAALDGRDVVTDADGAIAARLVLAPRATRLPATEPPPDSDQAPPPDEPDQPAPADAPPTPPERDTDTEEDAPPLAADTPLQDLLLAAATAAIPPGLLAQLKAGAQAGKARAAGKSGALQKAAARGRPAGSRRGEPRAGQRLALIDTLRAAAPWQRLRRAELDARAGAPASRPLSRGEAGLPSASAPRVLVRREDFHVTRLEQRRETTTLFVVDASGSSALNRLAEAKGAVELLLADCYVRRDRVAVIGFRGASAELLLPPTRSLVRAKRSLAGLPGGGGTPLATALDAAAELADAIRRRGETPGIVLLTDGRANIGRDGKPGRAQAEADASAAARRLAAAGHATLFVDTSPRAQPAAAKLAAELRALYLPLPFADARSLSAAVKAVHATGRERG